MSLGRLREFLDKCFQGTERLFSLAGAHIRGSEGEKDLKAQFPGRLRLQRLLQIVDGSRILLLSLQDLRQAECPLDEFRVELQGGAVRLGGLVLFAQIVECQPQGTVRREEFRILFDDPPQFLHCFLILALRNEQ